jgi:hypothetical protein
MNNVIEISLLHLKYEDKERESMCVCPTEDDDKEAAAATMAVTSDHEDEEKVIAH